MTDDYLIAPRSLPDGRVEWEPQTDIVRRLREGDPSMGWEGEPNLSLVLDVAGGRWQVWRGEPDGDGVLICTAQQKGLTMPGSELIRQLQAHDTRRVDVVAMVEDFNDGIVRERDRVSHEQNEAIAEKLGWALGRDLDIPAQDGRLYPLGGSR